MSFNVPDHLRTPPPNSKNGDQEELETYNLRIRKENTSSYRNIPEFYKPSTFQRPKLNETFIVINDAEQREDQDGGRYFSSKKSRNGRFYFDVKPSAVDGHVKDLTLKINTLIPSSYACLLGSPGEDITSVGNVLIGISNFDSIILTKENELLVQSLSNEISKFLFLVPNRDYWTNSFLNISEKLCVMLSFVCSFNLSMVNVFEDDKIEKFFYMIYRIMPSAILSGACANYLSPLIQDSYDTSIEGIEVEEDIIKARFTPIEMLFFSFSRKLTKHLCISTYNCVNLKYYYSVDDGLYYANVEVKRMKAFLEDVHEVAQSYYSEHLKEEA